MPLILRYAARELRAGLRGFAVFLACLTLGVFAIAGVNSVARSMSDGLSAQGRTINGGDLAVALIGRETTPDEAAFLKTLGRPSTIATTRAMVRLPDGRSSLVELKAVDGAYPLDGTVVLAEGGTLADHLAGRNAVAEPALYARLGLAPGATVTLGTLPLRLTGTVQAEPDRLAGGIGLGPRLIVSLDTLRATGLIQPGALIRWTTRVALASGTPAAAVARLAARFPQAGWEVRTREDASPELKRSIDRFTLFLTLVSLTALVVGGVGVANAVRAFVEGKRDTIATLKTLGAPGGTVFAIYLAQTMLLGLVGIAVGLVLGAALPYVLVAAFGAVLPLPIEPAVHPADLGLAGLYGLLAALAFSLLPLGAAHDVPVSALFRAGLEGARRPRPRYLVTAGLATVALAALAVLAASDRRLAVTYGVAAVLAFALLRVVAWAIMALARRVPHPRATELRLAIANLHRPGALTASVVLSLGLGLTLLVALALIDGDIRRQLGSAIPDKAPSFFFLDLPQAQAPAFDAFVRRQAPGATLDRVPMLRGRFASIKGVPVEKLAADAASDPVLRGDRGFTTSATVPDGSHVVEGAWWPADYSGTPEVSVEDGIGRRLGLHVGDTISVNVLGRELSARVANLRHVEWESFGINFFLVFSPNTFRGAPVTDIATLTYAGRADTATEMGFVRVLAERYPSVTAVRVRDVLDTFASLASKLALASRGAASVAILASVLVLAGALAAGRRARAYDAVVLKMLGATRGRLLAAYLIEYGLLGLVTAAFGVLAGTLCAWYIVERMMEFSFTFLPGVALMAAFGAMAVTVVCGLLGTWRLLGQRPAPALRSL